MKTRTVYSQVCLRHPVWPRHQTPMWVLLALEQTLLLDHHLLNARNPLLFLLALGQTQLLSHYLLIAQMWSSPCWGLSNKHRGTDDSFRGWPSPPTS